MASSFDKVRLFDDENDEITLKINKEYAQNYSVWREKEELQKLKTKYGDEIGESSSSSEEEDEDAEALTGTVDRNWFRVMAALRRNDPKIYQKDVKFFEDEDENDKGEEGSDSGDSDSSASEQQTPKMKKKGEKPMSIKDYQRKIITERNGEISDSDGEEEMEEKAHEPGYFEEQAAIKKSLVSAIADMSSGDEDEDILKQRVKTQKEKDEEEQEYIKFLRGDLDVKDLKEDKDMADDLAFLRDYYSRPDVSEDDKVLWRIILEQSTRKKNKTEDEDWYAEQIKDLYADEEVHEEQEEFENKYNFRFEEPDDDYIKRYQRNPEDTVRQKVNKRAQKRQEVKERKEKEMAHKREEIRLLKKLKKKEVVSKLEYLIKEHPEVEYSSEDLKKDFDPEAHDRMMQEKFAQFYEMEGDDEEKPVFDDDDEDVAGNYEDWDDYDGPMGGNSKDTPETVEADEDHEDEDDFENTKFNMDADYDPSQSHRVEKSSRKRKKSKLREAVEKKKPQITDVFEKYKSSQAPWEEYTKEFYKLDYNEYGYKYHNTTPADYGLDCGEILWLPTRELNSWVSIKTVTEHKSDAEAQREQRKYQTAKMQRKKHNVLPSLAKMEKEEFYLEDIRPHVLRKQRGLLPSQDEDDAEQSESEQLEQSQNDTTVASAGSEQTVKKKKRKAESLEDAALPEASPQKKKRKKTKKLGLSEQSDDHENAEVCLEKDGERMVNSAETQPTKKKKKKVKSSEDAVSATVESSPKKKKKLKKVSQSEQSDDHENAKVCLEKDKHSVNSEETQKAQTVKDAKKKKRRKKKAKANDSDPTATKVDKEKDIGKKKKKNKNRKPNQRGYLPRDEIQPSRLESFRIDARKYKYIKHKIVPTQSSQD